MGSDAAAAGAFASIGAEMPAAASAGLHLAGLPLPVGLQSLGGERPACLIPCL